MTSLRPRLRNRLAIMDRTGCAPSRLEKPLASFTFDDFPKSAYELGGRILEEAGARATYFASAEFMGGAIDGIDYYTPELLREAYGKGHEIGCHAYHHVHLGARGAAFARDSVAANAAAMQQVLGDRFLMTSFAYPYGDVSPSVKRAMSKEFALCRGVRRELNTGRVDLAQLSVVSLESRHWNEGELARSIRQAAADKSWIVFLTHDVSESPTAYGSTPEMMRIAVAMLAETKISILPLKAAAARLVFGENAASI